MVVSNTFPTLTSIRNPRLQQIIRLRRKKYRINEGLFVVETFRELDRAIKSGYKLEYMLVTKEQVTNCVNNHFILPAENTFIISEDLVTRISYRQNPSGIVAVFQIPNQPIWDECIARTNLLLAMVGLRVPGNIGVLLRSADALAVRAALLIDSSLDLYNPNLIRNSTGACFLQNLIPMNSEMARLQLRKSSFELVAAAVEGEVSIYEHQFSNKVAVLLGEEKSGLSEFWLREADVRLRIPMNGMAVDSLNVATCGSLMMYEVMRQQNCRSR